MNQTIVLNNLKLYDLANIILKLKKKRTNFISRFLFSKFEYYQQSRKKTFMQCLVIEILKINHEFNLTIK